MTYKTTTAILSALALSVATPALAGHHADGSHKMKKMKKVEMTSDAQFKKMDVNADMSVDFTEFADYMERYGVDSATAAEQYIQLAGSAPAIKSDNFAGVDVRALSRMNKDKTKMTNMDSWKMDASMSSGPKSSDTVPTAVMGSLSYTGADYGQFGDYDMDGNGTVAFDEYAKARKTNGVSMTAAAQEFVRMSDGEASFDEIRFNQSRDMDVLSRSAYRIN